MIKYEDIVKRISFIEKRKINVYNCSINRMSGDFTKKKKGCIKVC